MNDPSEEEKPDDQNSGSPACSTDVVSEHSLNQWFDYWVLKSRGRSKAAFIERLRGLALRGLAMNQADRDTVNRLSIERLRQVIEKLEREACP